MIIKKKGFQLVGVIFFVLFATFFMVRLDLFRADFFRGQGARGHGKIADLQEKAPQTVVPGETWMTILQNGKHIGFSRRILEKISSGYRIHEKTAMTINTMGLAQDLVVRLDSETGPDLSLLFFDFEVESGRFRFKVTGSVENLLLKVTTAIPAKESSQPVEIKLKEKPYLAGAIVQAMAMAGDGSFDGIDGSGEMNFSVFDPVSMGEMPVRVRMMEGEFMDVVGEKTAVKKLALDFKGMTQYAFVDGTGRVVKEEGILGITLVAATKEQALDSLVPGDDFTLLASVLPTWSLDRPKGSSDNFQSDGLKNLSKLVLTISGIDIHTFDIAGGRQSFQNNRLTITRESLPPDNENRNDNDNSNEDLNHNLNHSGDLEYSPDLTLNNDLAQFLLPAPLIQSNHPDIVVLAQKIVKKESSTIGKIRAILAWMNKHIEQRPVISLPDALSTLKNRMGDCNEHAVLFAALCRSLGIPTRIEAGLVFLNDRFYYHAWNGVFLNSWTSVDSLFNQFPADVTHIRLSTGKGADGFDIMGAIGRIKIEIVGAEP